MSRFVSREIDLDFPVSLCRVKVSIDPMMIGDAWRSYLPLVSFRAACLT
jgi:hypothetical protein